jgi:hypothetical protein
MPETPDDAAALRICRAPKPGAGAVKGVLRWAMTAPRPDKVAPLLLLQTDNYLNRKGRAAGYAEALDACAAPDPAPLWKTIEEDWETYRIWHAIRAVGRLRDKRQTERLIALGDRPILRIHWSAIREAAAEHGLPIPAEIAAAQARLEAERGPADFREHFLARKAAWPAALDLETAHHPSQGERPMAKTAAAKPEAGAQAPAFLDPEKEKHAFLKAHKQALQKKWSLKSMNPLFDAVDLAFYLAALGRNADAAGICGLIADSVSFSGNYNVWTPVGYAICLRARLLRLAGKAGEADAALKPVIATPMNRTPAQAQIDKDLGTLQADLDKALAASAKKAACQSAARKLYTASWYLEFAHAKVPGFGSYAIDPLETLWREGLGKLAARLDS